MKTKPLIYNDKKELVFVSENMILLSQRGLCEQKLINGIIKYLNSINRKVNFLNNN